MEWVLIALTAAGGGGFLVTRWRARSAARRTEREDLEAVRHLADEDVTYLGEQLQRLDREVSGSLLDEPTRADYQKALDAYETAQRAVPRIRTADEISTVTDTLSTGRYALACVQARVAGRPVPEHTVPCFFNPQHGPSVANVMWTQPAHGTRLVPACAQDAARVADHESPVLRQVKIDGRMVPYWQAGAAFLPYGRGYFGGAVLVWAFQPTFDAGGFHGGFDGGGSHGGGFDGGGFDTGGFDGGGGGGDGGGGGM